MNGSAGRGSDRLPVATEALAGYLEEMLRDSAVAPDLAGSSTETDAREPSVSPPTTGPLPGDAPRTDDTAGGETVRAMAVQVFSLAGLKLALPSGKVRNIVDALNLAASAADSPPWVMGTLGVADINITVVNLCGFILPPERQPLAWQPSTIIVLQDSCWGLGCDGYLAADSLEPGHVLWRTVRTRRSWLAGTVSRFGYALIDVDALIALFDRQTKS